MNAASVRWRRTAALTRLLVALLPRDAAQLLPNPLDVPAVLPTAAGTARRRQVGHDLAGGDVALDGAQRQPERLGELRRADELGA